MAGALDDLTVISFGRIAQGPVATQMLADLGAEVLKMEPPGGVDAPLLDGERVPRRRESPVPGVG